jgi:ribosomal protein S13
MGSTTLQELLASADGDDIVGKIKVLVLLESLPGVGKVKARRTMVELGISESRRVRGLGPQQREALLRVFPQKH